MTWNRDSVSPAEVAGRLAKTRLWMSRELADDDRKALVGACSDIRTIESHADIRRLGTTTDALHIVLDGWAARYKRMKDSTRHIPALILPGDICDLDAAMFDRVDLGIITITTCVVAVLPRNRAKTLMANHPRIAAAFLSLALTENAILGEWAASIGRRSARQRVGRLLCELLVRLEAVGKADEHAYDLPLTQEHLGDATGLTSVHVNRTLQVLRTDGLVTVQGRKAIIHDWAALKAMCGFQPSYLHLSEMDGGSANRPVRISNGPSPVASIALN
jgi:CRP-like cAMP-binding protein